VQACIPHYGIYEVANESAQGDHLADRLADAQLRVQEPAGAGPANGGYQHRRSRLCMPTHHRFSSSTARNDTSRRCRRHGPSVDRLRDVSKSKGRYAELPGAQHAFDILPVHRSAHVVRRVDVFLRWAAQARPRPVNAAA